MRFYIVFVFLLCSIAIQGQELESLNDSIRKYTIQDPQKALKFGFKAISESEFKSFTNELYNTYFLIGQTFFQLRSYGESLEYLSQSLNIYESLPDKERIHKNIIKPPWILILLGNVFFNNDEFEKATAYYVEALENFKLYHKDFEEDKFFGLNTAEGNLALISIKKEEFEKALNYYDQILNRRKLIDKKSDLIFSYIQFSTVYYKLNKEEKALEYFNLIKAIYEEEIQKTDFKTDSEVQLYYSNAISNYASYLQLKNKFNLALELLYQARELAIEFSNEIPTIDISIVQCQLGLKNYLKAEKLILNNLKSSFINNDIRIENFEALSEVYMSLDEKDKLLNIKDSLLVYTNQSLIDPYNKLDTIENKILLSEKQRELNQNQIRYNRTIYLFATSIIVLILIVIILRINFNLQKEKGTRLELEKNQIQTELSLKKRELFSKTNFILQRNEYFQKLKSKLEDDKDSKTSINQLKKEISTLVNSESIYHEFDKKFVEVFPEFYKKINDAYSLSKIDFRLIAYIKMNKSNNEIARISGISIRTVQSQRYRLSKKLNLDKNQDLNSFIFSI